MARLVILGAGVSGHTAALHARRHLHPKDHEVVVISPNSQWNWIPSNIWVGVGVMKPEQVTFPLAPVYQRKGITFIQAKALSIHPEGAPDQAQPFIRYQITGKEKNGQFGEIAYDYLINATGPKLNFEATEGLGPKKNSYSVCTYGHAHQANQAFEESVARLKHGEKQTFLIGTGHGTCTCQGAAFEYLFNVEFELRKRGVRDKAEVVYVTNERELGDFGMGGMHIRKGGYISHSRMFTESLFAERDIRWIDQAHVKHVDTNKISYLQLDGREGEQNFDFSMLLPPFSGVGLTAFDKNNQEITADLFAPNQFMRVDADYSKKAFEDWKPEDWPETYQSPVYPNIYAIGIAFAPPHGLSKPLVSPDGTLISPAVPRTGMPSGVMAREVALNIVDMMKGKENAPTRTASMAKMGAACIASAGASTFNGTAASITMYPIVPDYEKYPDSGGRDLDYTSGEIGLAGHWIKHLLHFGFIYKAKGLPGWQLIPE